MAQSITPVFLAGDPAPGGGTFSGINFAAPLTFSNGSVFFDDSSAKGTVGTVGNLAALNIQESTIAGLSLSAGQTLDSASAFVVSSPAPGSYVVQVPILPGNAGTVIVSGAPGNFTKLIQSGELLPGTPATFSALRFSPSLFRPLSLPTLRGGAPVIHAITADDSASYVGIYRNGVWETTQAGGIDVPGLPAGTRLAASDVKVAAGNSAGQFLINQAATGPSGLFYPLLLCQNGTLQNIVPPGSTLPGDSRVISAIYASSINDSGTVGLSGFYLTGGGFVARWSAAGGLQKVTTTGDLLTSVGGRATFKQINTFQRPVINASGAMLFVGDVELYQPNSSSISRSTLLYQSGPGAPIEMVALTGETVSGLEDGTVIGFSNSDVITLNDAGQISLSASASKLGVTNSVTTSVICGGTAPNISVLVQSGGSYNVDGIAGNTTFSSVLNTFNSLDSLTQNTEDFGARLSTTGQIYFRGSIVAPPLIIGSSVFPQTKNGVFKISLSGNPTGTLATQTITVSTVNDVVVSSAPIALSASSSSGLPVSFKLVSGPATLSGNTLTPGAFSGEVVLLASQSGSTSFLAARDVELRLRTVASAADLPYDGPFKISPIALPGRAAPGGRTYSGVGYDTPLIAPAGQISFKDATPLDIVGANTPSISRLNLSASTVTGLTLPAGQELDAKNVVVLSSPAAGQYFLRAPLTLAGGENIESEALLTGTPGNFTKLLQDGEILPGTTSVWRSKDPINFTDPLPLRTTRGGQPMIYAAAPTGSNTHIGIYRNGVWENTQIGGVTPPGYAAASRFGGASFTAANAAGQFLFTSTPTGSSLYKQGLYIGQNGTLQRIASTEVGVTIGGDSRQIVSIASHSINDSGVALVHGTYRAVSGNSNQGGYLYRWSTTGGLDKVITRGEPLPAVNSTAKFYSASQEPLINNAGELLFMASYDPFGTDVLGNFKTALFYQSAPGAAIERVVEQGTTLPGLVGTSVFSFGTNPSLSFNNSGEFALLAASGALGSSQTTPVIYAGRAPNIQVLLSGKSTYIAGLQGSRILNNVTDTAAGVARHGVTGEFGAPISDTGEFPFRCRFTGVVSGVNDSGVFVAKIRAASVPDPLAQTITFSAPIDMHVNTSVSLSATSTSALPVTYSIVSGPATVSGNTLTAGAAAGLVIIRAEQAGNASFLAAPPVERSFRVAANISELYMNLYLASANVSAVDRLPNLDLDGDGLSNLLEFALGGNPLVADFNLLPDGQIQTGVFVFTYRPIPIGSVVYSVTSSSNLAGPWSASAVNQGAMDSNGFVTASVPMASGSAQFLRLEVSLRP